VCAGPARLLNDAPELESTTSAIAWVWDGHQRPGPCTCRQRSWQATVLSLVDRAPAQTTFLQLLIEASAGHVPAVIVDPKGSPALEEALRAHRGVVWTLDGKLPADLLDPRPWQVPDLLLEAEDYSADARAYRDAVHHNCGRPGRWRWTASRWT
jgi:hypothetical protein